MTAKPRRVALYLRASTDGQSTALQRRDLVEARYARSTRNPLLLGWSGRPARKGT